MLKASCLSDGTNELCRKKKSIKPIAPPPPPPPRQATYQIACVIPLFFQRPRIVVAFLRVWEFIELKSSLGKSLFCHLHSSNFGTLRSNKDPAIIRFSVKIVRICKQDYTKQVQAMVRLDKSRHHQKAGDHHVPFFPLTCNLGGREMRLAPSSSENLRILPFSKPG